MKNRMKVVMLIAVALLLMGAGIILSITLGAKKEDPINVVENAKKEAEDYVKKLTNILIKGGTKKELTAALYTADILPSDIMTGPDMYLRQQPEEKITKNQNLDKYYKKGEKLAKTLEKTIQDNFEYDIEGIADGKKYVSVLVNYRSYYYNAYINDLTQIQNELLIKAGYNLEDSNSLKNNQFKTDMYKAKIKAAALLDTQLVDYRNETETQQVYIEFINMKPSQSSKSFLSYLMNIRGYTHSQQGRFTSADQVNAFITNVDVKDPLAI